MRRAGWQDFALPLTLMFAVVFALTVRQELSFSPAEEALAATARPDYVMTITAKRIPAECRTAAVQTATCSSVLAGDARVEMREGNTRLADRNRGDYFAY